MFQFVSIPSSAPFMGFKKVIRQNSSLNCTLRPGDGFPDSREPGYTRIFTRFLPPVTGNKLRALKIQRYLQARTGRSGLHTCTRDFQAETFRVPSPVPWIACIKFGCRSENFENPNIFSNPRLAHLKSGNLVPFQGAKLNHSTPTGLKGLYAYTFI